MKQKYMEAFDMMTGFVSVVHDLGALPTLKEGKWVCTYETIVGVGNDPMLAITDFLQKFGGVSHG